MFGLGRGMIVTFIKSIHNKHYALQSNARIRLAYIFNWENRRPGSFALQSGVVRREQESRSVSLKQVVYGNAGVSYTCCG